jgi:hypothetical protein
MKRIFKIVFWSSCAFLVACLVVRGIALNADSYFKEVAAYLACVGWLVIGSGIDYAIAKIFNIDSMALYVGIVFGLPLLVAFSIPLINIYILK